MNRIGITMRITNDTNYHDPRDSIARDWSKYILSAFPDSQFIFLPNVEEHIIDYINSWGIDILVLSGGDDIGAFPARDKTETIAFLHALKMQIPIVAICRGLQLVHTHYGGELQVGDNTFINRHEASRHLIEIDKLSFEVNSYHKNKIIEQTVHKDFEIFARCKDDNSVEGLRNRQILGMMWHPERDEKIMNWNKLLIEDFIKNAK